MSPVVRWSPCYVGDTYVSGISREKADHHSHKHYSEELIESLSLQVGVPFQSGSDSRSGDTQAEDRKGILMAEQLQSQSEHAEDCADDDAGGQQRRGGVGLAGDARIRRFVERLELQQTAQVDVHRSQVSVLEDDIIAPE